MKPTLLLVRHAERPEFAPGELGNETSITIKGEEKTRKFGEKLSDLRISIRSSPVRRCMETAQIIAGSARVPVVSIIEDNDLGDPGYIISSGEGAWVHWQEKGHERVKEYLIWNEEKWEGFTDLDKSSKQFAEKIQRFLEQDHNTDIHIWITHDTILGTFASRVSETQFDASGWPDFLGYLSITLSNGTLEYLYHSKTTSD